MIKAYAAMSKGEPLEAFEYDPGDINKHEVEIDVESCGICHSDLSMLDNEWGMTEYPFVPGHEVIGTVKQVGSEVTKVKKGQRVGLGWHSGYCDTCHTCQSGDHNLCGDAQMTIGGRHGGFAEQVRADEAAVIPIPDELNPSSTGPMLCGGITVYNPLVQFNISPQSKVGVIGIGGLGHMALQFLNAWGCEVVAFTSKPDESDKLKELGAHSILDSTDENAIEEAAGQFDYILSTVNVKLDWNKYVGALKPKGRLHFVGATLEPLDLEVFPLIMGQRSVSGSPVGSPATIKSMLDFAVRHNIEPKVEYFSFDEVNKALDRLRNGKPNYRVVLKR